MKRLPALIACCILGFSLLTQAGGRPGQVAIASAHPAATVAGLETLAAGGNAFDAAVAVSAALAVTEPYGSGLGGGGFFLLRKAGDKPAYHFLDAREKAPQAATPDMYREQPARSLDGALAAAIPGLPAALADLASRYGRLPLAASLAPAIRLAEDGFPVDRVYRERADWRLKALRADPESARIFLEQGEIPEEFSLIRQPQLAKTLKLMAAKGHDGFYRGPLAEQLVTGVRAGGGIWSLRDLADYRVVERQPLRFELDDQRLLISAPPPSAGGVALAQSLGMLQQLPWKEAATVQRTHLMVEVLRRAYRDRGLLGDPDYVRNPLRHMLDPAYLKQLSKSIDPQRATPSSSLAASPPWHEGDHTTHFSLIDADGNAVAATLSINLPFGAAFTAPGTGVLLNDEMDDFAADPQGENAYGLAGSMANAIAPGKRPLSSMSPTFIESPTEFAAFGTPGGSRIPSMVLISIMQYLDAQPVSAWPEASRFHHQYLPDRIEHEPGTFSPSQVAELKARGHALEALGRRYGNQQVLLWRKATGQLEAASDPRGIGLAASQPERLE